MQRAPTYLFFGAKDDIFLNKKIVILFLCSINNLYAFDFSSLTQVQRYATEHPENIKPDNTDWDNLNYSSYHKSITPNFLHYFLHKMGIKNQQMSFVEDLKELLEKNISARKNQQLPEKFIRYLPCVKEAKVILINDLKGSFHALVRILTWLHKNQIIDEQFKIIQKNIYFVFNGDCINGSAYTLETFYMILLLMYNNFESVFYIRGKDEHENYWYNLGLKRELKIRAAHLAKDEQIPLGNLVSEYFSLLSYALYISAAEDPLDLIKIIAKNSQLVDLDENLMGSFLLNVMIIKWQSMM